MSAIYVPILAGKEGELGALRELELQTRARLMPLIEIPDIPFDWEGERPAKSLAEHLVGLPEKMRVSWNVASDHLPILLDAPALHELSPQWDDEDSVRRLLGDCQSKGLHVIPVFHRKTPPWYLSLAREHALRSEAGLCLRLFLRDFDDDVDLEREIVHILTLLKTSPDSVDLVVDLETLQSDVQTSTLIVRSLKGMIPFPNAWRRVILAGASFPQDLSDVSAESTNEILRVEWELWKRLQLRPDRALRPDMIFADYGISNPVTRDMDPRMMRMSASIRYTTPYTWLVIKGRNVRQWGFDQYYTLCESIVSYEAYRGALFSWGDLYIAQCARRETGPGNATTWRKVGTNHHLTLVANQIANPDAP